MQLPPDEAVVMVSSVAPIKAKKLRYYADANFKPRASRRRRASGRALCRCAAIAARRLERPGDPCRSCGTGHGIR